MRLKGNTLDTFVPGLIAGAGLMYLLDPHRGRRRRARLRDQGAHLAHSADQFSGTTSRDLKNRVIGLAAETRSRLHRSDTSDAVVAARVRSLLGRLVSHPGAIDVESVDGCITLRGEVLSGEVPALIRAVSRVKGVTEVMNELMAHQTAEDIPTLREISRKPQYRQELLQENWAPAIRLVMGGLGSCLAFKSREREGPFGTLLALAGGAMLGRALTNLSLSRLTGINAGRRAIDLHKIITVHAPVREVFDFWSDFENFPLFMSHLKMVRDLGRGRSHWTAEGPAGIGVSWDAEITGFRDGELIAWKSIGASPIRNAGIVRFERIGDSATRLDVRMSYNPPGGAIGHLVASLFRADPKHAMDEDLVRLKSLLEVGKTTSRGFHIDRRSMRWQPTGTGSDGDSMEPL